MGEAKRRGSYEERRAEAEARVMAEAAHGAARNMVVLTNTEAYEYTERGEALATGCMAVTVCGIGIAACVLLGLLLAGLSARSSAGA